MNERSISPECNSPPPRKRKKLLNSTINQNNKNNNSEDLNLAVLFHGLTSIKSNNNAVNDQSNHEVSSLIFCDPL